MNERKQSLRKEILSLINNVRHSCDNEQEYG